MSPGKRSKGSSKAARQELYETTSERYQELLGEAEQETVPDEEAVKPTAEDLGWRSSRRTSRVGKTVRKSAKREARVKATKEKASGAARTGGRVVGRTLTWIGGTIALLVAVAVLLWVTAAAINGIARWNAQRLVGEEEDPAVFAQDNLLVIGVEDGQVAGFLALRVEETEGRVFGIAIPDAAFMEVPGQGFESAGASFKGGPEVSAAAISNFLTVRFDQYVVVSASAYQTALQEQSLTGVLAEVQETNLPPGDLGRFTDAFGSMTGDGIALVPLPVKPISLGDETYFEPQREEVADLLFSWWGVSIGADKDSLEVIVYNGSGVPGIAGVAARALISQGFRVVETRNAEDFDYEKTLVILYHGDEIDAERVQDALGVGEIVVEVASQQVADILVIIGKDYEPPGSQDG